MSYIRGEVRKIKKDIIYYEKYRHNLKKFVIELLLGKSFVLIKYYSLLEEVDRITIKIESLKVIKESLEKYREF